MNNPSIRIDKDVSQLDIHKHESVTLWICPYFPYENARGLKRIQIEIRQDENGVAEIFCDGNIKIKKFKDWVNKE